MNFRMIQKIGGGGNPIWRSLFFAVIRIRFLILVMAGLFSLIGCDQQKDPSSPRGKFSAQPRGLEARAILPEDPAAEAANPFQKSKLPVYELKIETAKLMELERTAFSDQTQPAIFIAEGKEQPVKVRYRGAWARSWPKKPFKIFFEKGHDFQGNHSLNLNSAWRDPAFIRENLAYHVYAVSGVPTPRARMVRLDINGRFYGLYVEVEQPDKRFLKRHNLQGAAIYKADSPANTSDERDLGSEQSFSVHYEKETQTAEGYRDLQLFCRELSMTTNAFEFFNRRVDLEKYINYLAATALVQNWDCFNKNHFIVHDGRGSEKWFAVPWDLDRTFGDHWHGSFDEAQLPLMHGIRSLPGPTGWNRMADRLLSDKVLRNRFLDRLQELLQKEFIKEKLFPLVDELESQIATEAALDRKRWPGAPANFRQGMGELKSYIERRRTFLLRETAKIRRG